MIGPKFVNAWWDFSKYMEQREDKCTRTAMDYNIFMKWIDDIDGLTHWPQGDFNKVLVKWFSSSF